MTVDDLLARIATEQPAEIRLTRDEFAHLARQIGFAIPIDRVNAWAASLQPGDRYGVLMGTDLIVEGA